MNSNIIPIFIENYLAISKTFIYRQLKEANDLGEKILLVSSKPENLDIFPFPRIYSKSKNVFELLALKFYEKVLRDRIFFHYYRVLSYSQKKYFSKILDKQNIKFVHAHFGTAAQEIYKIVENLNKSLLISFHGADASLFLKSKAYCNNLSYFFRKSYIIVPSNFMKERLEKEFGMPKKMFIIHYGIPIEFFNFVNRELPKEKIMNDKKVKFLQVSSFREKKGHIYTIKAFAKLRSKYNNIELIFGGDGPELEKIKREVKKLGIESSVVFLGNVNQERVNELFRKSDLFLHHSITAKNGDQEGIPNVIMEAMATGLPTISTFHAGIPELIIDSENGYLVNEKDIKAYSEKMEQALLNADENIVRNARETIEKEFNLDNQIEKLHSVYKYLLQKESKD